ncbi:hypothetical protein H0H87_000931 [Tephrocybe sp. NHM501043]|nr:hypothetical protein H0H87_000931 [Tephrocybe sp. NHM501043]
MPSPPHNTDMPGKPPPPPSTFPLPPVQPRACWACTPVMHITTILHAISTTTSATPPRAPHADRPIPFTLRVAPTPAPRPQKRTSAPLIPPATAWTTRSPTAAMSSMRTRRSPLSMAEETPPRDLPVASRAALPFPLRPGALRTPTRTLHHPRGRTTRRTPIRATAPSAGPAPTTTTRPATTPSLRRPRSTRPSPTVTRPPPHPLSPPPANTGPTAPPASPSIATQCAAPLCLQTAPTPVKKRRLSGAGVEGVAVAMAGMDVDGEDGEDDGGTEPDNDVSMEEED